MLQQKISKLTWLTLFGTLLLLSGCEEAAAGILAGGVAIWAIGGLILFILVILAVVDLLRKPYDMGKKILWLVIILVVPYIGAILYFMIGRSSSSSSSTRAY